MSNPKLRTLDNQKIAIELTVNETKRVLKGLARYEPESDFGPLLRIAVDDLAGDFELLVRESEWTGQVSSGERFGCDYAIRLDASSLCLK